jgi:hypothetical protein
LTISNGEIGDVALTTVEVRFNTDVVSPTDDYISGVTIKRNSVSQTISSATRQSNHRLVHYVLDTDMDINDAITFEYDDDFGDYQIEDTGNDAGDIAAESMVNYIGSHLYFNRADSSGWL